MSSGSMHAFAVPVFVRALRNLRGVLEIGEKFAADKGIAPEVMLQTRLVPDMLPLVRQVQIACDFAKSVPARLAGEDVPVYDDTEENFGQLRARIARTLPFADSLQAAQFEGGEQREIVLRPGTPKERKLDGRTYLLNYGLPQFFFHVTTAYDLLRLVRHSQHAVMAIDVFPQVPLECQVLLGDVVRKRN